MADVDGAVIGDGVLFGGARFAGKAAFFTPGGPDNPKLTRFYLLRGWDPSISQWESWSSKSSLGVDNPSNRPLAHVTQVSSDRPATFNEE